jgi:hypothetical protein
MIFFIAKKNGDGTFSVYDLLDKCLLAEVSRQEASDFIQKMNASIKRR